MGSPNVQGGIETGQRRFVEHSSISLPFQIQTDTAHLNSLLVNAVALSETTTSGKPRVANDVHSSSIVGDDVAVFVM